MGVVIHHQASGDFAAQVKAAARGDQLPQGLLQGGEGGSHQATGGDGGEGIAEVVAAGHGQQQLAEMLAVFQVVGAAAVAIEAEWHRPEAQLLGAGLLLQAPPVVGLEVLAQHRTIVVGQHLLAVGGEATHGGH